MCAPSRCIVKGLYWHKMLGKYTEEGGQRPELDCLPSAEQPGTWRAYFPNSPWLSGLQPWLMPARMRRGISSAPGAPAPRADFRPLCWTGDPGGSPGGGLSDWPWGALPSIPLGTWFSSGGSCLGLKILASYLWCLSRQSHKIQQEWHLLRICCSFPRCPSHRLLCPLSLSAFFLGKTVIPTLQTEPARPSPFPVLIEGETEAQGMLS